MQLQAVMEAPYYQGKFHCPWDVPKFKSFSTIRVHAEMTLPEIGLVFAQLANYNQIPLANDGQTVLQQIVEAETLVLPGGIRVVCESQKTISPSCCCGLETWREWLDFLKTGNSPWLGHDPSPWLEIQGETVRIWSDGGLGDVVKDAFYVDVSRDRIQKALRQIERDLQGFLYSIESWAQTVGFEAPAAGPRPAGWA